MLLPVKTFFLSAYKLATLRRWLKRSGPLIFHMQNALFFCIRTQHRICEGSIDMTLQNKSIIIMFCLLRLSKRLLIRFGDRYEIIMVSD